MALLAFRPKLLWERGRIGWEGEGQYICNIICRRLHFRHAISHSAFPHFPFPSRLSRSAYRAFNYVLRFGAPVRLGHCAGMRTLTNTQTGEDLVDGGAAESAYWPDWADCLLAKPSDIYLSHCTLLLNALSSLSCALKSRVGHGIGEGHGKAHSNGITLQHCARYFLAESESHVHYFRPHVCRIILIMHLHFRQTVAGNGAAARPRPRPCLDFYGSICN